MLFKKYCLSKLIVICCVIVAIESTLSPPRNKKDKTAKQKDHKTKQGPISQNVFDRNLIDEEPLASQIIIESQAYYKETGLRQFNGTVLGYVTPWNSHGYDVAKTWGPKFDTISPVWLQILRKGPKKYELAGTHDVDAGWMKDVRKSGGNTKIYPRILFDHFTDKDFSQILTYKEELDVVTKLLFDTCRKYKFDGFVLEVWSQLSARVDDRHLLNLVKEIAVFLKSGNYGLILVIPPVRKETVDLFTPDHFEELFPLITGFSLMTYDYSNVQRPGANAPLYWVQNAVEHICPSSTENLKSKRAKILLGLNFYGSDYTPEGGNAILGHEYLNLVKFVKGRLQLDEKDVENFFEIKTPTGRHVVFYPTLFSINERIKLAREMGTGLSIWELGQGLDYFYDLL